MRHKKHFWIPFVAFLMLTAISTLVYAQPTASEIVSNFNGLNGGQGYIYNNVTSGLGSLQNLTTSPGSSNVDTSGYYWIVGGTNFFQTIGIEPETTHVASSGMAKLSYNATTGTTTTTSGTALTFGAAYLYSKFALGGLVITEEIAYDFYTALNTLTGTFPASNWDTNDLLRELRVIEANTDYWTRSYNPGLIYSAIGNYSIFVMNTTDLMGLESQDTLYIARSTGPTAPPWGDDPPIIGGVPEPATLLLWTLGGLGFAGTSWAKKRKKK